MLMAAKSWPGLRFFFLVTLAMASARTAGMTLNLLIDRTRDRPMLTGELRTSWAWVCAGVSAVLLVVSAAGLNPLCVKLSPLPLIFLTGYHYAKRDTE